MKKAMFLIVFCQLIVAFSFGQSARVKIFTLSNQRIYKGYIVRLGHASLTLTNGWTKAALNRHHDVVVLPVSDIRVIKVKGRRTTLEGAVIGTGLGFVGGGFLGLLAYSIENIFGEPTDQYKVITLVGTLIGTGTGGLIGTGVRKNMGKYFINGDREAYLLYLPELIKISL